MAGKRDNLIRDALVGVLLIGAIAILGYMATRLGAVSGYGAGRTVTFVFDDATGLVESAPVAASGVRIGSVTGIAFSEGGALVTAKIEPGIALHADATGAVRSKSLLGEKFVALDPGTEKAGALSGDRVKTVPSADIDRMAAAIAKAVDAIDPNDLKAIAHGLALALGDDAGVGKTMPGAIKDVVKDLHDLARSIEGVSEQGSDLAVRLKPILAHLDEVAQKSSRTLDELDPSIKRVPGTLDHLDRALARIDALTAKADKIDPKDLVYEIKKIFEEEGVYVRLKPRKVGPGGKSLEDDEKPAPSPKAVESPPRL